MSINKIKDLNFGLFGFKKYVFWGFFCMDIVIFHVFCFCFLSCLGLDVWQELYNNPQKMSIFRFTEKNRFTDTDCNVNNDRFFIFGN